MTRDQLIQAVALRMDEITPSGALSGITVDGSDNNPLCELIKGIIDDGVLELFTVAPFWRLPQSAVAYSSTAADNQIIVEAGAYDRKIIRLKVPDDFLRVAEISCTDFQRPITEVVPEQSEPGKRQHNRFLMGKEARPVGVMSHGEWNGSLCREIDCYSLSSTSTVTSASGVSASYIARPDSATASADTTVPVPDVLLPALEWLIAARAFGSRGDANHSAICQQNAQNLLT